MWDVSSRVYLDLNFNMTISDIPELAMIRCQTERLKNLGFRHVQLCNGVAQGFGVLLLVEHLEAPKSVQEICDLLILLEKSNHNKNT